MGKCGTAQDELDEQERFETLDTPDERLTDAETTFQSIDPADFDPTSYACLQALLAIGRLLQSIDNRQAAQAAQQAGS